MSHSICDNHEKDDCLVANAVPNGTRPTREPNAKQPAFADLEPSELDNRLVDRPALLLFKTL